MTPGHVLAQRVVDLEMTIEVQTLEIRSVASPTSSAIAMTEGVSVMPEDFDHLESIRRKLVFHHAASAHELAALARFEAAARAEGPAPPGGGGEEDYRGSLRSAPGSTSHRTGGAGERSSARGE